MVETTSTPVRVPSPLSRPKAAFNGHTGFPPSLNFNGGDTKHAAGAQTSQDVDEDVIGQDPSWEPEVYNMGQLLCFMLPAKTYILTGQKTLPLESTHSTSLPIPTSHPLVLPSLLRSKHSLQHIDHLHRMMWTVP